MIVEQIYTGCLSHGAYYIESSGEAAIIDPLREVNEYIDKATANNSKIKFVFETHFHADFVSGHLTLSKATGAPIVFGPNANPNYKSIIATDNQVFKIGDCSITAIHTPGHTMESTTYLLKDNKGKDHAIFTGDTLFLGDVGRPDLSQKSDDLTMEDLAGIHFESLRKKILPQWFFIFSNFGVWLTGSFYEITIHGLITCYTMAIPFFSNTFLSTIIFALLIEFLVFSKYFNFVPQLLKK